MHRKLRYFFTVNIIFFIYSFTGVLTKYAAREQFLSPRFLMFYGGTLALMGVYAIVWQQIIQTVPLMVAYTNKAVVILWGLLWGALFFNERISIGKLTGALMAASGVVLFAQGSFEGDDEEKYSD